MERSAKVAISLPERMLKAIEKERKGRGESRSEFFRRAAERLLKQEEAAKADEEYVRAYTAIPESSEEVAVANQLGTASLAKEPWDETR